MDSVKNLHVLATLDLAFRSAAKTLQGNVTPVLGLRPSHYRLLDFIPPEGIRLSHLASRANITKASLGEFVAALEAAGVVDVLPDPTDGRARLAIPTSSGRAVQREIERVVAAIESDLVQRVGLERWTVFREVLTELAEVPDQPSPPSSGSAGRARRR